MKVLMTTRGSSGHLLPLAPIGHACVAAGHEVCVAAQAQHAQNVERTGLRFAPVGDPPAEEWMPLMDEFARLDLDTANERMVGDFFAGIDTRASLPALTELVAEWRPDLIVRESWEFASTIVADRPGIPVATGSPSG
jgi:UDP:flavonoid glycosyltransferase YjiC (YdhE family)